MIKYSSEWYFYHLKNNGFSRWFASETSMYLMSMTADCCRPFQSTLPFKVNQWDDFAHFEETESWHNKTDYLKQIALQQKNGGNCVTLVLDNKLIFSNFFGLNSPSSFFSDVSIKVLYPPSTTTQYSAYIHPAYRGKGIYVDSKKFISNYLFNNTNTKLYVGAVKCENRAAHKGQLASGLHSVARIEKTCFLGRRANSVDLLHPDYQLLIVEHDTSTWKLEHLK